MVAMCDKRMRAEAPAFRGIISKFEPSREPLTVMIADIKCRLFCFSCKLLAFHAEMCQMTADGWPSILKREGSLYTPTCIETVVEYFELEN